MPQDKPIKKKPNFLVHISFQESIAHLSLAEKGMLFDALFTYQKSDSEPEKKSPIYTAFRFIKQYIDNNNEAHKTKVIANRNNGSKSKGAPKKQPNEPSGLSSIPPVPKEPEYELEQEHENLKKIYTKKTFQNEAEKIQAEAQEKYPDKDAGKVMREFLEGIEIKNYGYKNYKLAYFRWVRLSNHSRRGPVDQKARDGAQARAIRSNIDRLYGNFRLEFLDKKFGKGKWTLVNVLRRPDILEELRKAFQQRYPEESKMLMKLDSG